MTEGSGNPPATGVWRWTEWLLLGQVTILTVLNCLRGLGRSIWLDESLTWWATSGSLGEVLFRSVEYQGQTPFFYLTVWPMARLFGENEMALRLPSLVLLLLATFLVYRLGRTLLDREGGLLSALLFQALWVIRFGPPDARPYTLAICLLVLATLFLVRWEQGRRHAAWVYVAAMLGSVYAHVLFAPAVLAHTAFLATGESIRNRSREWIGPAAAFVLGTAPIAALILMLRGKWSLYSFAPMPTPGDLLTAWMAIPVALVVCGCVYLLGGTGRYIAWRGLGLQRSDHALVWTWALLPALILFVLSHLRDLSIFVPRYHVWQVPGMALLITGLIAGFASRTVRVAVGGGYFVFSLTVLLLRPVGSNEDWRRAVAHVNAGIAGEETPVLVWSGLAESRDPAWLQAPESRSYLLAPTSFYDLGGRIVPVPHPGSVQGLDDFMAPAVAAEIRSAPAVWVLAYDPGAARTIADWTDHPDRTGPVLTRFGRVTVAQLGSDARVEDPE